MRNKSKSFITIFFVSISIVLNAQFFEVGVIGGSNFHRSNSFSEFQGCNYGLNTGLIVKSNFSYRWYFSTEMLYIRDGNYIVPSFVPDINFKNVRTDFVEIPLYLSYTDENYINHFSLGLSFIKLIGTIAEDGDDTDFTSEITWRNTSTLSGHLTYAYYLTEQLGLDCRVSVFRADSRFDGNLSLRGFFIF